MLTEVRISLLNRTLSFVIRIFPCRRVALLLLWSGIIATFTGCAGYQLGPTSGVARLDKSVQIVPFSNTTLEPRLSDAVTAQLRKELQHEGTFRLATHEDGDIVVTGAITHYQRGGLSFNPGDTLTVRDFRLNMTARVTARERSSGKLLLDKPVAGYTIIRFTSDLPSAERQALSLLADDLAKHITALLADGSW
jgi:hypothetical protein